MGSDLAQQQELFQAPPRSRIAVPAGHTAWWGVDGSTKCIAIGVATEYAGHVRRAVRSAPFPSPPTDGRRLAAIHAITSELAAELADRYPPGLVLVEQPSGSSQVVNHELEYAVGVIQAAVYAAAGEPRMDMVVSSWWKARACGHGNLYKTMKVPGSSRKKPLPLEEYGVMRWARLVGYKGGSWDEADALGIAEAARREHALIER
jgi:hypothetical protein